MIQTLGNAIKVDDLGLVLMHEHIFNQYPRGYKKESEEFTIEQLERLKKHGVKTIIDLTPYNNIDLYNSVIERCDFNIVGCIGFYLSKYIPKEYRNMSENELVYKLSKVIEGGTKKYHYKPGILKIASSFNGVGENEKKYFNVVARLSRSFEIPIATHSPKGAFEHSIYLQSLGVNMEKVFLSHAEFNVNDENFETEIYKMEQIVNSGSYLLFSKFGTSYNGKRYKTSCNVLSHFKDKRKLDRILISSDCNWKWKNYNAKFQNGNICNYEYVFNYTIPGLIKKGFSDKDIKQIMIINPKKIFS